MFVKGSWTDGVSEGGSCCSKAGIAQQRCGGAVSLDTYYNPENVGSGGQG